METYITFETFKGHPVLAIRKSGEGAPLVSFGLTKAKAILDHIDEIQAWIEENDTPKTVPKQTPKIAIKPQQSAAASPTALASAVLASRPVIVTGLTAEQSEKLKKLLGV